ncbi:MAG: (2Fe-2S)-binding protein [Candidatus Woesebacteria bacterium]
MAVSLKTKVWQGILYPRNFLKGHMEQPTTTLEQLQPGQGAIVEVDGKKVAAYKNDKGEVVKLSAVCTHLGCIVGWNGTEKTWDCPCHGSRFSLSGKVLKGPATKSLPTM